jgi:hypothetical protein
VIERSELITHAKSIRSALAGRQPAEQKIHHEATKITKEEPRKVAPKVERKKGNP